MIKNLPLKATPPQGDREGSTLPYDEPARHDRVGEFSP